MMKIGLVLGKFNPLHLGHIALIEFAQDQCDELIVLIIDKGIKYHLVQGNWEERFEKSVHIVQKLLLV